MESSAPDPGRTVPPPGEGDLGRTVPPPGDGDPGRTVAPPESSAPTSETLAEVTRAAKDPRRRLGRFVLLSELGRGGMGIVFRAWDPGMRRVVALKTILASETTQDGPEVARFGREVEAMARLRHPNIVRIHETGEIDERRYFVMDLVEGSSFAKRVEDKENPLPLEAAVAAVRDAALAVHHANEQGIVHRDMKPGNMLVGRDGHVYVIDFGLARLVDRKTRLTKSNAVMGTPAYMPPEQAGDDELPVNRRSDVYSLGATLYFALTGEPPFVSENPFSLIAAVISKPPVPPRKKNPAVGRDLEAVCLRCLEKTPADRYASALELAQDLDRCLRGVPSLARPRGFFARIGRSRRARLVAPAVAAGLLAAGMIALPLWGVIERRRNPSAGAASVDTRSAGPIEPPLPTINVSGLPGGARSLGKLRLDGVLGSDGTRLPLPLTCIAALPDPGHVLAGSRGSLFRWDLEANRFEELGGIDTESIAVTRDGRYALSVDLGGMPHQLRRWDLGVKTLPLAPHTIGPPENQDWGPGRRVALGGDGKLALTSWQNGYLWLVSVPDGASLARFDTRPGTGSPDGRPLFPVAVALSDDGRTALAGLDDGASPHFFAVQQYAIEPDGGRTMTVKRTFPVRRPVGALAISRDGKTGALGDGGGSVWLLDLARGGEPRELEEAACLDMVGQVAFLDDRRLLAGAHDGTIEVCDTTARAVHRLKARADVEGFAVLPGDRIALAGSELRVSVLDLGTPGGPVGEDPGHSAPVEVLASSSDGKRVLSGSADHTLKLWDVAGARVAQTFVGHTREICAAALSEDGTRAISAAWHHRVGDEQDDGRDNYVRLWDTGKGVRVSRTLAVDKEKGVAHEIDSLALSADGGEAFLGVNPGSESEPALYRWRTRDADGASEIESDPFLPHAPTRAMVAVPGSPFRAFLASDDLSLRLVRLPPTGDPVLEVRGTPGDITMIRGTVTAVAAARREATFLCGTTGGDVFLWSSSTDFAKPTSQDRKHDGEVRGVAFSPDGKRAVSFGATDGKVCLWTTDPLHRVADVNFTGELKPRSVAFPEDHTVLVGTSRGLILRYGEGH